MTLELTSRSLQIAGRTIEFSLPADPEQMLAAALEGEQAGISGSDPYWGLLWAAAPKTAELILKHNWGRPLRAIELGCGVGVAGIAALLAGHHVTFADHAPPAVRTALLNAARNGFPNADGLVFGWHQPPERQFEFIVASDVLYDAAGHQPLLTSLKSLLQPGGCVWIGDAGRANAPAFANLATACGWNVELRDETGRDVKTARHMEFRLLILSQ